MASIITLQGKTINVPDVNKALKHAQIMNDFYRKNVSIYGETKASLSWEHILNELLKLK